METLDIIKESFETWYNQSQGEKTSVGFFARNRLNGVWGTWRRIDSAPRVYHVEKDGTVCGVVLAVNETENYNHGITSEQEAKDMLTRKLLVELYNYMR